MATKPHLRADSASRRFQPLPFLNRLYNEEARQRPMPNPRDGAFEQWQKETRKLLHEILAPEYAQQPMKPKRRERADCGDYWRLYYEVETAPDLWVPFFVLTPKDHDGPAPGILCLHGRGYGMNEICGLLEDGNPREGEDPGYQKDFAIQAVQAGFVAVVPDQFGFGRRRDFDFEKTIPGSSDSCQHPSMYLTHLGRTMAGLRLFDALRMLDLMEKMEEIQSDHIGVVGISCGGFIASLVAGVDPRIKAACISGFLNEFRRSILAMHQSVDHFVAGLGKQIEMLDLAGLIAPRPLLMESGTRDTEFPIGASRRIVENLQELYGLLGAPERFTADIFSGDHEFSGRQTWEFFQKWLASEGDEAAP